MMMARFWGTGCVEDAPALRITITAPFTQGSGPKLHHLQPIRVQNPNNSAMLTVAGYVVFHVVASSLSETGTKLDVESHTV